MDGTGPGNWEVSLVFLRPPASRDFDSWMLEKFRTFFLNVPAELFYRSEYLIEIFNPEEEEEEEEEMSFLDVHARCIKKGKNRDIEYGIIVLR